MQTFSSKMAKQKKQNSGWSIWKILIWILIILAILTLAGVLLYGGLNGWFSGSQSTVYINEEKATDNPAKQNPILDTCEDVCVGEGYHSGYDMVGSCTDGTTQINYGYPNEDPLLKCCCIPDPEGEDGNGGGGYTLGDIITEESDLGTMGQGINDLMNPIEMPDIELGGPCHLGAKIWVQWDYVDEQACSGIQGFETMAFYFYDSNTGVALDVPRGQQKYFEFCPKYYDGVNDWMFEMQKLMGMYSCEISYSYTVQVYVCECD